MRGMSYPGAKASCTTYYKTAVNRNITADNLVNEAFDRCGIDSPTDAQSTRAIDYFLQEILNDIMNTSFRDGNTRLKSLQDTFLDASVEGQRTLALAEAVDEELDVCLIIKYEVLV